MGSTGKCIIKYAGFDNDKMFEDVKTLSKKEVEDKYGYNSNTIKKYLKSNGYEVINFQDIAFNNIHIEILNMWQDGISVKEICTKLNLSSDTVYNHLKKEKINYSEICCDVSTIKAKKGEVFIRYKCTNYAISTFGRVYSFYSRRFLKPSVKTGRDLGYTRFCINGSFKYAHRMVAELFLENKNNYDEVNHIDMDRENNNVSNLEWCSRSQNIKHMLSNKENYDRMVDRAKKAGMKNAKKIICLNDENIFNSISDAKEFYGIRGVEQISRVCTGKNSYVRDNNGNKLKFNFIEGDTNEQTLCKLP